jgi:hypothetical protein
LALYRTKDKSFNGLKSEKGVKSVKCAKGGGGAAMSTTTIVGSERGEAAEGIGACGGRRKGCSGTDLGVEFTVWTGDSWKGIVDEI